jgi:hypothetical protein
VALFENLTERISDGLVVLLAADFFFSRTGEPNEMIGRDPTLLSVKVRELDRIGSSFVVESDRRLRQRLLFAASINSEQKDEREYAQGGSTAPRAMPIMCGFAA